MDSLYGNASDAQRLISISFKLIINRTGFSLSRHLVLVFLILFMSRNGPALFSKILTSAVYYGKSGKIPNVNPIPNTTP